MSESVPKRKVAVIGLGYVGLPVAVSFAKRFPGTVGFDISKRRIEQLERAIDVTGEVSSDDLSRGDLKVTTDPSALGESDFFIVTVPTPIDANRRPDLTPLVAASRTVGRNLKRGDIVVYESTVYPGVTEEVCGPILEEESGLKSGVDFTLGYSPERINPGDKQHTFERITKVVSGQDADTLDVVAACYGSIVEAGVHRASTIRVAEAAKVIENTQRDLNIALMNELAVIFDRLGIDTIDVLEAAGTKWNFLPFRPGLVGGHCIGVDPYYLTAKAEMVGVHPEVILAGRRINDTMGVYVAQRVIKQLIAAGKGVSGARVGVAGITFKENVPDIRNSQVPSILRELQEYGVVTVAHDPMASAEEVEEEYGLEMHPLSSFTNLDAIVLAVPHRGLVDEIVAQAAADEGLAVFCDVKGVVDPSRLPSSTTYWRL